MSIYRSKVDANQPEIVKELRRLGAGVWHTHALKKFCDLMVVYKGVTAAVEVKMPGGKQTAGEKVFEADWVASGGDYYIIESVEQARIMAGLMAICGPLK